jgi:hypothetical protein
VPDQLPDLEAALARLDARDDAYWNAEAARAAASAPLADTDGERDYAEEAAVRAESDAENATEQAHADLVNALVDRLRDLGTDAHGDALLSAAALTSEVGLRQAPNVHRYELLARHQHTALLAAMVAAAVEETGSYEVPAVAESVVNGYRATHLDAVRPVGDLPNRALLGAIDRVVEVVREVTR